MNKINTVLLSVLIATVVLVGGGIIYSLNKDQSGEDATGNQSNQENNQATDSDSSDESESKSPTPNNPKSQVIDGVAIPAEVLAQINSDYPDYIIDDADREVDDGRVYYEINLDHRDPANDSDYELTYSEDWELIEEDFDRD